MPDAPAAESTCPRCGQGFHCGAGDSGRCWCTGVVLDTDTLAALARQYTRCLCGDCLRALAGEAPRAA
jgi:hypothetical protein